MKVKISYSLELDKVPSKVRELMQEGDSLISHLCDDYATTLEMLRNSGVDVASTAACISRINKIRLLLSNIDLRLQEQNYILEGYLGVLESKEKLKKEESEAIESFHAQQNKKPEKPKGVPSDFMQKVMEQSNADEG